MEIKYGIDLSELLKHFIQDIKKKWETPFSSPVVIFPNSKLEQWFKYNWLKDANNGILMNLEYARMESFLFDCVRKGSESLSENLIRDMLILKLQEKYQNGNYYIDSLGTTVTSYLKDGNNINEVQLYDFASQMAKLFTSYEVDMIDWDNNTDKVWEKTLYDDLLGSNKGITLHKTIGEKTIEINYKTLYEAYMANNSKLELPAKYKGRPLFIFGFSGIGKLHREMIGKIAEKVDVSVYLQYDDDKAKIPVASWADNGKAGLKEWQNGNTQKTTRIQSSKNYPTCTVASCPSKLREVEVLHSEICRLIQDNDKKVRPSDILVLAPNISDYSVEIDHIFNHDTSFSLPPYIMADGSSKDSLAADALDTLKEMLHKGSLSRDNLFHLLRNPLVQASRHISVEEVDEWLDWVNYLNIYRDRGDFKDWDKGIYRILLSRLTDGKYQNGDTTYLPYENMQTQNSFSLVKFINVVKDAQNWCEIAKKKRVGIDDLTIIEELLASFLHPTGPISKELEIEALIYAKIKGAFNQQRMLVTGGKTQDLSMLCLIMAMVDAAKNSTISKGLVFLEGMAFSSMKPNRVMSADYVFMLGMDSKSFPGIEIHNTLDIRGCKSIEKQLPAQNKNTFLCQFLATGKELHISYVNRDLQKDDVFYCASVVNQLEDLKLVNKKICYNIDEQRDKSLLFTSRSRRNSEIFEKLNNPKSPEKSDNETSSSTLAETNSSTLPDRVYLSRLVKFLEDPFEAYVERILGGEDQESSEIESSQFEPIELEDKVLASKLRKQYVRRVLEEYLKNDLENTIIDIQSIDLDIDRLKNSIDNYENKRVELKNQRPPSRRKSQAEIDAEAEIKNIKDEINKQKESRKDKLVYIPSDIKENIKKELTDNLLDCNYFNDKSSADKAYERIEAEENIIYQEIIELAVKGLPICKLQFDKIADLTLKATDKDWKLQGNMAWHAWDGNTLHVIEIGYKQNFMTAYVTALAEIAMSKKDDEDEDEEVSVCLYSIKKGAKTESKGPFTITASSAKKTIENIYIRAYQENYRKCVFIKDVIEGHPYNNWYDFLGTLNQKWEYFSQKNIVNRERDLGYTGKNFVGDPTNDPLGEYDEAILYQRELVLFVNSNTPIRK